jgi:glycosyltransferase involved in cell wall biosynthesis
MQPAISIVVPSYNQRPEFVSKCLTSIFTQEGATYEVIFVDGGSRPETLHAAEQFRNRCAHFISEADQGQADAINKGLRLATGDLVGWLNTDDFYEPGAFLHMVDAFAKNPVAPFYMGAGFRADESGDTQRPFYPDNFCFDRRAFVYGLNYILQPATFIRRHALEQVGGELNRDLHYVLDSEIWFRLLTLGDPEWVPFPTASIREYSESKTATGAWIRFDEIRRLATEYSGLPITPGIVAELMRLLHESLAESKVAALFPDDTDNRVRELWTRAGEGLRNLSGRSDGFPVSDAKRETKRNADLL